ncbi:MAG: hypothetical protein ABI702_11520, partial [Burkholderiales bacterium]
MDAEFDYAECAYDRTRYADSACSNRIHSWFDRRKRNREILAFERESMTTNNKTARRKVAHLLAATVVALAL